ncbi:pantetheinase-like isoform X2 [Stegodyphus dumicola]|nr:pantetheinase-like isoform X2 [Stegodyphus dumicola]
MRHYGACFLFFYLCFYVALSNEAEYFTAAVYEHARPSAQFVNLSEATADDIIFENLAHYKRAVQIAKSKVADILVFPEYGIFPAHNRNEMKPYLERIPDPKKSRVNPCNEREKYQNRRILFSLSCMAKQHKIVIVANMGGIESCKGQKECPEDGSYQFNTNVVFDRDGTLLLRYYKERLFYELGMDLPPEQEDPTFVTDFGTFATFISFDIMFAKMSAFAQRKQVDAIALSSMWINIPPQTSSVQFWESWSLGYNTTLLAANIQIPGHYAVGSGIFRGADGPLAYTFNPDGVSKVVVARVPKRDYRLASRKASITEITLDDVRESLNAGSSITTECSVKVLGRSIDILKDFRCTEVDMINYSFVKLMKDSDHIESCINGVCCSLKYSSNKLTENFYLMVFNGSTDFYYRYSFCEQTCTLIRCEAYGRNPCSTFPMKSKTLFYDVQLAANFSTKDIFPSVVSSDMKLTSLTDWSFDVQETSSDAYQAYINFKSLAGEKLLSADLRGRCYDRDPPYIR